MNLSPFWSCILRNCSTWGILWVQKIRASSLYFILSVDIFSLHSIYLHSRKKHPNGEPGSPRKEEKTLRFVFCCHHLKRKTSCFVCFQGMLALSFTGNMAANALPMVDFPPWINSHKARWDLPVSRCQLCHPGAQCPASWPTLWDDSIVICGKMRFNRWKIPQVDNGV